ncbi:MAG: hypothetical protein ACRDUW_24925 [Pseudonocardiaceae bacterium]
MSDHGGFGAPAPSDGMTENLSELVHPPVAGPAPVQDLASILGDPAQHFQLDLDQAPQAIAAFRQVAQGMRDLMDQSSRLANVTPPGLDAVSINAAKEIGQWAISEEPGSLRWALESGAVQLEKAATALERSLASHRNTDEVNAAHLSRRQL